MLGAQKDRMGPARTLWAIPSPFQGSLGPQQLAWNQKPLGRRTTAGGAEEDRSSMPG